VWNEAKTGIKTALQHSLNVFLAGFPLRVMSPGDFFNNLFQEVLKGSGCPAARVRRFQHAVMVCRDRAQGGRRGQPAVQRLHRKRMEGGRTPRFSPATAGPVSLMKTTTEVLAPGQGEALFLH